MEDDKVIQYAINEDTNRGPEVSMVEFIPTDITKDEAKEDVDKELSLKDKYGEVYEVELSFDIDEDIRARLMYCFKKPNVSSYDRYIKGMSKSPAQASRVFVMDNVIKEQKAELASNLEKYPAAAMSISSKLLEMLGFGDVSLTQL